MTQLIVEISYPIGEQATGVTQIGEAVSRLDESTQQNAALVEESAAAAESLRLQAADLAAVVQVFRLRTDPRASPEDEGASVPLEQ